MRVLLARWQSHTDEAGLPSERAAVASVQRLSWIDLRPILGRDLALVGVDGDVQGSYVDLGDDLDRALRGRVARDAEEWLGRTVESIREIAAAIVHPATRTRRDGWRKVRLGGHDLYVTQEEARESSVTLHETWRRRGLLSNTSQDQSWTALAGGLSSWEVPSGGGVVQYLSTAFVQIVMSAQWIRTTTDTTAQP